MGEEPEIYLVDFSDVAGAAEDRERREQARAQARRRYRDYLAAVFRVQSSTEPGELADVALDALTVWRLVESGRPCLCSCHPRLPASDLHDYGFGCVCARTAQDRRRALDNWRSGNEAFWQSAEGKQIVAAERAAEAELETWLATQRGVLVDSLGGYATEQWRGGSRRPHLLLSRTP